MIHHQRGISYIGVLVVIMALAFFAKILIAVCPPYLDDRLINSQIEEVIKQSSSSSTPSKFAADVDKRLQMNNIRDTKFDDVATVSFDNGIEVTKKYEVRKNFLLNIDLVLTFEKSFDQRSVESK